MRSAPPARKRAGLVWRPAKAGKGCHYLPNGPPSTTWGSSRMVPALPRPFRHVPSFCTVASAPGGQKTAAWTHVMRGGAWQLGLAPSIYADKLNRASAAAATSHHILRSAIPSSAIRLTMALRNISGIELTNDSMIQADSCSNSSSR